MARIHLVLQCKGGVGKSFISSVLAQYKAAKGEAPFCVDTDPFNATFSGYAALKVKRIDLMEGNEINTGRFDELIEWISTLETDAVIDNGAASFAPLSAYLIKYGVVDLIASLGHELVIHTVITGGQALGDTLSGFKNLVEHFGKSVQFVVWLNPYWGKIELDGKTFEEMALFKSNRDKIAGLIKIPSYDTLFSQDLKNILTAKKTFAESLEDATLWVIVRHRIKRIRDELFGLLEAVPVI
jgi:hypothetical protein